MAAVQLNGIHAVVFDLDDTLYPERSYAFSGFEAVAAWLEERFCCPFGVAKRMRELFDTPHRPRVFDQILTELDQDPAPDLVGRMVEVYRRHKPTIALFPDADDALRRWHGGYRLGLVSDGPLTAQQNKVEALGLADRMDRIVLTDAWGTTFWKPHPRAFEELENAFNCRKSACVYIADNPQKDFVGPRKMGWRTIRIRRPGGVYEHAASISDGEPDFEVASLAEIGLSSYS